MYLRHEIRVGKRRGGGDEGYFSPQNVKIALKMNKLALYFSNV